MSDRDSSIRTDALRQPAVSVIVTNYNYADYVVECLRSVVEQTIPPIECIVVDDASTDNSVGRIRQYIEACGPITEFQVVELQENAGQMNAFVEGFRRSSGDFLVFVDSDDYLFPDFIETHLAAHLNTEYAAALTSSNEVIVDGSGAVLASSMEKTRRTKKPQAPLQGGEGLRGVSVEEWIDTWDLGYPSTFRQPAKPLIYVGAQENRMREFIWSTTSGTMFRRGALDFVLADRARDMRISADFYLFHYCHLLGGTAIIQTSHGFYRRHGANNFASAAVVGRGARSWGSSVDWNRKETFRRLERDLLDDVERLREMVGTPRMLQVLAIFVPSRRIGDVFRATASRPADVALYLLLLATTTTKKGLERIRRLWDYT